MSELPPVPSRDKFTGSLGDRHVMDYVKVMTNLGHHLTAVKQVQAFAAADWSREEVHELLDIMTNVAQRSISNEIKGVPVIPKPSREAVSRVEIQRRADILKGKPKFTVIEGDKE